MRNGFEILLFSFLAFYRLFSVLILLASRDFCENVFLVLIKLYKSKEILKYFNMSCSLIRPMIVDCTTWIFDS